MYHTDPGQVGGWPDQEKEEPNPEPAWPIADLSETVETNVIVQTETDM
ncbi:hypothetical protein ACYJ1Y_12330 [Natrialbaceae archaeon A-gly3]